MALVNAAPNAAVIRIFEQIADAAKGEDGYHVISALATATIRGFIQLREKADSEDNREWMRVVGQKFIALSECSIADINQLADDYSDAQVKH